MSFSIGIIGLPNVGKSTLFKALTSQKVAIASYPFTTIDPNIGIVNIPDERLKKIASVVKPEKITETAIEFVDIAGLVKNAHKGEGLGNQFLSRIRECDAIIEVVRNFEDFNIEHIEKEINPENDIKIIDNELLMKDLEALEKAAEKSEGEKSELLKRIKELKKPIREINLSDKEKEEIKEYRFLTEKPIIYLFNVREQRTENKEQELKKLLSIHYSLFIDLKIEEEASELSPKEKEELDIRSRLDQLIINCYNILELITFFTTVGNKEAKAWTLKKNSTAFQAAGKVHSDFQEKFVRAEIINWRDLVNAGSWLKAKESGKVKTVGKEHIIQDGEIIEFKI